MPGGIMMHHILTIVDDEHGRECEIEHLTECPTQASRGYLEWICPVGWFIDEAGLPDELTVLPAGEYNIDFWHEERRNYTGVIEHEYGIALV
jgi:hypothetical protein